MRSEDRDWQPGSRAIAIALPGGFLHPDLGIAWDVPEGWKTRNTPGAAGASAGNGSAVVLLPVVADGSDPVAGARPAGLDLTWIALGGHVYRIAGMSRAGDFDRFRSSFEQSARSFRRRESLAALIRRTDGAWNA